jgi:hypothetical protein
MYSVPCKWPGLDLIVRIGPTTVTIVGRDGTSIVHTRTSPLARGVSAQAKRGAAGACRSCCALDLGAPLGCPIGAGNRPYCWRT